MRIGRIVDLSHRMYPGKEEYGLELVTHFTDELLPGYRRDRDVWYILQDIRMSSHCGTHIEFPFHHKKNGMDAGSFPLERLIGECLLLDFTHKRPNEAVTLDELKTFEKKVRSGDMLLFNFDCSRLYYTEQAHERPYITTDAIEWLVLDRGISLIGSDASGIEVKGVINQPNHQFLMDHGIPIIEFAAHLDQLRKERFLLFALAICIVGLDSCPVRLVAIEEEDSNNG